MPKRMIAFQHPFPRNPGFSGVRFKLEALRFRVITAQTLGA
jgi:hypothetical protein